MPAASTPSNLSPAELSYLHTSLSLTPPIRPDARSPRAFRTLHAETDILPSCNGSSHVSLGDGSEAMVGIKAEVARTPKSFRPPQQQSATNDDTDTDMNIDSNPPAPPASSPSWLTLSIDIPTLRDDDPALTLLTATLTEPLHSCPTLLSALPINHGWHWHLSIDIVQLSTFSASRAPAIAPLPLLSPAVYLALQSTRLPNLVSQGEEDPLVDDDWANSVPIFPNTANTTKSPTKLPTHQTSASGPPLTLLIMTCGPNLLFDPSAAELSVSDGVFAISISLGFPQKQPKMQAESRGSVRVLAVRTLDTPARDTMPGVASAAVQAKYGPGEEVPGCWRPRVGGVRREVLKRVVGKVEREGVGREVLEELRGFGG